VNRNELFPPHVRKCSQFRIGASINVSIVICTRNRAESLRDTLTSIGQCEIRNGLTVELVVIDNGSNDETRAVVEAASLQNVALGYVNEPRSGQSYARNRGLKEANGDLIVFTDDDVRVDADWVEMMCGPILRGEADAVQGGVRLAKHLERSWMTAMHRASFACASWKPGDRVVLVGANMAVSRRVFSDVPEFDTEIGLPVASGGEDTLFSFQVERAGFRMLARPEAQVEHHFNASRISRANMIDAQRKGGVASAYLAYHWAHEEIRHPLLRLVKSGWRLMVARIKSRLVWRHKEGAPDWLLLAENQFSTRWHYLRHLGSKRRYERFGLVKRYVPEERLDEKATDKVRLVPTSDLPAGDFPPAHVSRGSSRG
jgi:glucosyl-dolichyl phosphate glucuronosyltransferase